MLQCQCQWRRHDLYPWITLYCILNLLLICWSYVAKHTGKQKHTLLVSHIIQTNKDQIKFITEDEDPPKLNSISPLFKSFTLLCFAESLIWSAVFLFFPLYCRFLHARFLTLHSFRCNTHAWRRRSICCVQQLSQNRSNGKILLFLACLCLHEEPWIR